MQHVTPPTGRRGEETAFLDDPVLLRSSGLTWLARRRLGLPPALALRLARRWEGGEALSGTLRDLLWTLNGVRAGAYSYGALLGLTRQRRDGLSIGRFVSMSYSMQWLPGSPGERLSTSALFAPPADAAPERLEICSDAWIGDNVIITGACRRIGYGAAVGAGAIVTSDVPDFAIVTGTPAAVRRYRFSDIVQGRLRESRWWDLAMSDLQPWRDAFDQTCDDKIVLTALDEILAYKESIGRDVPARPDRLTSRFVAARSHRS